VITAIHPTRVAVIAGTQASFRNSGNNRRHRRKADNGKLVIRLQVKSLSVLWGEQLFAIAIG
jgi:hypothetical protein